MRDEDQCTAYEDGFRCTEPIDDDGLCSVHLTEEIHRLCGGGPSTPAGSDV